MAKKLAENKVQPRRRQPRRTAAIATEPPTTLIAAICHALQTDGRSLEAIAAEAECHRVQLSRLLRGERSVGLDLADRLCAVLGLEVAKLDS